MLRALLRAFGLRTESDGDTGDSDTGESDDEASRDDENGEEGFLPSRLDASVLEAHGMGTTAAERELASIEEKAQTLESDRPDEHEHPDHEQR